MIKKVTLAQFRTNLVSFRILDVPYSPDQFLGWDFFAASYSERALETPQSLLHNNNRNQYQWKWITEDLGPILLLKELRVVFVKIIGCT